MREQRRHTRKEIRFPVDFRCGDGPRVAGVCANLSVGGIFIETSSPAPFASEIAVLVRLPDMEAEASLPATVRWVTAAGMGVQFGLLGARETHGITVLLAG
jgi:type IV pilus assembly protein PilZ